jgi:hypothetical protein
MRRQQDRSAVDRVDLQFLGADAANRMWLVALLLAGPNCDMSSESGTNGAEGSGCTVQLWAAWISLQSGIPIKVRLAHFLLKGTVNIFLCQMARPLGRFHQIISWNVCSVLCESSTLFGHISDSRCIMFPSASFSKMYNSKLCYGRRWKFRMLFWLCTTG